MKKGDFRKRQILETAEQMFCSNGYERTSIQDILDRLKISKGSFYHHYVSKEALLESICSERAEQIRESAAGKINEADSECVSLDRLLSGMIPLAGEKLSFLLMLIPVFSFPEGRIIRLSYCDALSGRFFPLVNRLLEKGHQSGVLVCPDPAIACEVILSLVNRLWVRICDIILQNEQCGRETDPGEMLMIIDRYRLTIERMISLPYGSVGLIDIPSLGRLCEQIHNHWTN